MRFYGDNKNKHMKSVAEVMYENAEALGLDKEVAYTVGLLHDVGYIGVEKDSKDSHAQKGAEILERMGLSGDNLTAIRYHGTNCYQMIDEGKIKEVSPMLVLLQYADMSVDKYGEKVGFAKRLMDIGRRYGDDSVAHKNAVETVNFIQEVLPFKYEGNKPYICPITNDEFINRISNIAQEMRNKKSDWGHEILDYVKRQMKDFVENPTKTTSLKLLGKDNLFLDKGEPNCHPVFEENYPMCVIKLTPDISEEFSKRIVQKFPDWNWNTASFTLEYRGLDRDKPFSYDIGDGMGHSLFDNKWIYKDIHMWDNLCYDTFKEYANILLEKEIEEQEYEYERLP